MSGSNLIQKYCMIIFTKFIFVIQYLRNPDLSVGIQLYSQRSYLSSNVWCSLNYQSGSNTNIFRFVSWLVHQDPVQIFFESYPDSSIRTQHRYCFSFCSDIVTQSTTLKLELEYSNFPKPGCKAPLSKIWWGSA